MSNISDQLRALNDGVSRPVSILEREVCGHAADMIDELHAADRDHAAVARVRDERLVVARDAVKLLQSIMDAYDAGGVQLSSQDIQFDDDHPPHPWHEEWLSDARVKLAAIRD